MSDSLRGQFLVAGKHLRDPNFYKAVVLLIEHNASGAMGLVVNRPSTVTVANALSEHFPLTEAEDLVYVGGPVEPSALFIVHNSQEYNEAEGPVVPGVYIGSNEKVFERIVNSAADGDPRLRFRIYCGCAGWAPGQLEQELARGDWHLLSGSADFTLCEEPYDIWEKLIGQYQAACRFLPHTDHPEWN